MSKKKSNTKNIKVPKNKNSVKNLSNSNTQNSKKSHLTILYTPMGLALGLACGFIANNPTAGILGGLLIGGAIDFMTTMYKKKYNL